MENLEKRVGFCCDEDESMKRDFYTMLSLILEINSKVFVSNSQEEALSLFISKVLHYIKANPTIWEAEIKKEFTDCLLEMAGNSKWGERVNSEAKEALVELSLSPPPILKETKKEGNWFDFEQTSYILDHLFEKKEEYRFKEARKALRC